MALRCFARRHLVGPRRYGVGSSRPATGAARLSAARIHASFSTSSIASSRSASNGKRATEGVNVREYERDGSLFNFFTSHWQRSWRAPGPGEKTEASSSSSSSGRPDNLAPDPHPFVHDLMKELQTHEVKPSPELVWRLYNAVQVMQHRDFSRQSDTSDTVIPPSQQASLFLPPFVHKRVLRAIAPISSQSSHVRGAAGTHKPPSYLVHDHRHGAKVAKLSEIQRYLFRVGIIFANMRQLDSEHLPAARDYNEVMQHLARSGSMAALTALWSAMTGRSDIMFAVDGGQTSKRTRSLKMASLVMRNDAPKATNPTRTTYILLMTGVVNHLQDQIGRAYKADARKNLVPGRAAQRRARVKLSVGDVSPKHRSTNSAHLNPQIRQALGLAQRRTVGLLDDMYRRNVPLSKLTCDLALRVMRLTGNFSGLKTLAKLAFGIDLDNLDSNVRDRSSMRLSQNVAKPDVHTLNTIVLALGEQSSVSKMVAAYEALTKPLPRSVIGQAPEGSLFATDFRGIFGWTKESAGTEETEDKSAMRATDTLDLAIAPNTTTMTTLIRNTCSIPPPDRLLMLVDQTPAQAVEQAKEHVARESGTYVHLARYFIEETLSMQEVHVTRMASALGVRMGSVDEVARQVQSLDAERAAGLPDLSEESFRLEYVSRLMVLAGEKKPESVLSSLPTVAPVNLSELASATPTERLRLIRHRARAKKGVRVAHSAAVAFLDGSNQSGVQVLPDLRADFVPSLRASAMALSAEAVLPLLSLARQLRRTGLLRSVGQSMQRSLAIRLIELRVLGAARAHWQAVVQGAAKDETGQVTLPVDRAALRFLVGALDRQRVLVRREASDMAQSYLSHVRLRGRHLNSLRKARQERQLERAMESAREVQRARESHQQDAALRQARKLRAAEERAAVSSAPAPAVATTQLDGQSAAEQDGVVRAHVLS